MIPQSLSGVPSIAGTHVRENRVTEDFSVIYEARYGARQSDSVRGGRLILWACVMTAAAHGSLLIAK